MHGDDTHQTAAVADVLINAYGVDPVSITRIRAGTSTRNYLVVDDDGERWFAKVYGDRSVVKRELSAVELAEFARADGVPVPRVRLTRGGDLIADSNGVQLSLWHYVTNAETAEAGLTGDRWPAVGAMVGRLHRRLSEHPAARPIVRRPVDVCDVDRSRARLDRIIAVYSERRGLDSFEAWALDAAKQRRSLLRHAAGIQARLPALTTQIVHGDLSTPNLLMRGNEVAAVIDFQAPTTRSLSREIARIGCDPRTVLLGDGWITGLGDFLDAYRNENPAIRFDDLVSVVAVGTAFLLASVYPLAEPIDDPDAVDSTLRTYGKARHKAALVLLDQLDEAQQALNDRLQ